MSARALSKRAGKLAIRRDDPGELSAAAASQSNPAPVDPVTEIPSVRRPTEPFEPVARIEPERPVAIIADAGPGSIGIPRVIDPPRPVVSVSGPRIEVDDPRLPPAPFVRPVAIDAPPIDPSPALLQLMVAEDAAEVPAGPNRNRAPLVQSAPPAPAEGERQNVNIDRAEAERHHVARDGVGIGHLLLVIGALLVVAGAVWFVLRRKRGGT